MTTMRIRTKKMTETTKRLSLLKASSKQQPRPWLEAKERKRTKEKARRAKERNEKSIEESLTW